MQRRSFLLGAGTAATSLVLGDSARGFAANDTIRVGVIGTGGRARHLMKSLVKVPGVKMTALCDVWDVALSEAAPLVDAAATATKSYPELLADKAIDAVLIASPDHQHVPMTVAALKAGKDVYVEKPLTHTAEEGAAVTAAAAASKQVVQVGMQQRSMPHIAKARELVCAKAIGQVFKVRMSWNRNSNRVQRFPLGVDPKSVNWPDFLGAARPQAFDEYRFRNWRWFWDFGGGIFTDLMVHWIDVAHWVLGVDSPESAVSVGAHVAAKGVWETPDTVQTLLTYPGPVQMHFEGTFSNARTAARVEFLGTEGTIYLDRGRLELTPEKTGKARPLTEILGSGPPGADFYDKPDGELLHLTNWIDCVRSRKEPVAPVRAGVTSAAAAHLANAALRGGGVARS